MFLTRTPLNPVGFYNFNKNLSCVIVIVPLVKKLTARLVIVIRAIVLPVTAND
tara:strand:+ start:43 stop:201 length:159 start_codon:yes stop_codon:yes gene_type:complete